MLQLMRKKAAFTLIELLVVVIIVAVLAAVGIPLMAGQIARARLSEADAGLGTIRTAMRAEFAENGAAVGYSTVPTGSPITANIGVAAGDLNGRFFADANYTIRTVSIPGFCVSVTGATGTAPRSAQVDGVSRAMDQDGWIYDGVTTCTDPTKRIN